MDYQEDSTTQTIGTDEIKKFYKSLNKLQSSAVSFILKNPKQPAGAAAASSLSAVIRILDDAADNIGKEGGCPPPSVYDPNTGTCV